MGDNGTFLDILLIILSVAFLLFAGFSIPFLLQIWRTAKSMAVTLELLNQNLPQIMENLAGITVNVNRTTSTIGRQVEELSVTMGKIRGVLSLLMGLEEVLRGRFRIPFAKTVRTSTALFRAARVFMNILLLAEGNKKASRLP